MPFPSFLLPNVLQPQAQPPQTFPDARWGLLAQAQRAQQFRRGFGDIPSGPGLLDTAPYRLPLGMQPATMPPPGLLQPAMWDTVRRNLGLLGTEGVRGSAAGGGKAIPQGELALQGGKTISRNLQPQTQTKQLDWTWDEGSHDTTTPSGMRVSMTPLGEGKVDVLFLGPQARTVAKMSTQRGIARFGEVFDAIKDYVTKFKPNELNFVGASDKHDMLYDRIAPSLAHGLGGKLIKPTPTTQPSWRIIFGNK